MAQLPPGQQASFIAENKAALIKQLNFQPAQLHMLKSNHFAYQQQKMQQQMAAASAAAAAAATAAAAASCTAPGDSRGAPSAAAASPAKAGDKRPADGAATVISAPTLKQKRVAWVESQIKKDQNEAVAPNYRTPFRSKEDACKRLLRYHVFDELDDSPREMAKAEEQFETKAGSLLAKYRGMLNKYHYLLAQESLRLSASSEVVMLARMWDTEERQSLMKGKEEFKKSQEEQRMAEEASAAAAEAAVAQVEAKPDPGSGSVEKAEEIPPTTELMPPPAPPAQAQQKQEEQLELDAADKEDEKAGDKFLGLKFSRSQSGNWRTKDQDQEAGSASSEQQEYDEFESIRREVSAYRQAEEKKLPAAPQPPPPPPPPPLPAPLLSAPAPSSDSDEEFSLKDVDTDRAVGSILEGREDEEDEESESVLDLPSLEEGGDDDVQSAINSILDIQGEGGRIETPDFNNLAGLLDSIEADEAEKVGAVGGGDDGGGGRGDGNGGNVEEQQQDPVTEAAVNSIL